MTPGEDKIQWLNNQQCNIKKKQHLQQHHHISLYYAYIFYCMLSKQLQIIHHFEITFNSNKQFCFVGVLQEMVTMCKLLDKLLVD